MPGETLTLVVARLLPTGPRIFGDIRVTDPDAVRRGYLEGVLKTVLLHRSLCVSFAGRVTAALDAIRALSVDPAAGFDFDRVVKHLVDRHRHSGQSASFLVATLDPASLVRIESGVADHGLAAAWIGDYEAFVAYQRHYLARAELYGGHADADEGIRVATQMDGAMRAVMADASIHSVGEACVSVLPQGDGFRYADAAVVQPSHEQAIPSGVDTPIEFGTAAQGGFAYSILTPQSPGVGAVGIHFFQGDLGLLFYPTQFRSPEVYRGVTHDEFRNLVRERYGFDIQGAQVG